MKTDKLKTKSEKGSFVRYPKDSFGYYFYLPQSQKFVISRDAIFLEREFLQEGGKGRKIELELENSTGDQQPAPMDVDLVGEPMLINDSSTTPTLRKSSRISHPPERYRFLYENK